MLNIDRSGWLDPPASQDSDFGNSSCESFSELKSRAGATCMILHGVSHTTGLHIHMLLEIPGFFVLRTVAVWPPLATQSC